MEEGSRQLEFPLINLNDPRQDVHRRRRHSKNLFRYEAAEQLFPTSVDQLEILDLGGGTGELSARLKRKGAQMTFLDMSEKNVQNASENLGLRAYRTDLNFGLKCFPDSGFDGIMMLDVIEHIVASEYLLCEANRVLRLGGFLILTVPNFAFCINRARVLFGKLSKDEGYHYRFFTKKTLAQRLTKSGFQIKKRYDYSPFVGINLIVNKLLGKPRIHIRIPSALSSFFAHTLSVYAVKVADCSYREGSNPD